ncbi:citrate synthase, partial [Candidatus Woesearchaeota archaeon]|nr:citrate synthase [Candidatus Woesearchaeota archaeon]
MQETAKLELNGTLHELPVVVGTENEKGVDISRLKAQTGYITLDSGYANTGSCTSSITYIDGDLGILRYRGYDIAELCEKSTFMEVCYLLIYGELPSPEAFIGFKDKVLYHSLIHEDMKSFFTAYPGHAHPMAILSAMVCSLSVYHPELLNPDQSAEEKDETIAHLLSKVRVLAAFAYKRSVGEAFVYTKPELDYISNFMHMMFTTPVKLHQTDEVIRKALDVLMILHADHEQNCSTSTVRMVGSSKANLFAAISAGICALWGPLHGGANQAVIEMLEQIAADGGNCKKFMDKAKDKNDPFRLMGFGHRVYKNYDPRAQIIKKYCDEVLNHLGIDDPILEIAKGLEELALTDPYFIERKLYPNVDFYSGILYRAMKIPTNMFTVMFALGRLPGWIAHWKEMIDEAGALKIARPRQIYTGSPLRAYQPTS